MVCVCVCVCKGFVDLIRKCFLVDLIRKYIFLYVTSWYRLTMIAVCPPNLNVLEPMVLNII